MGGNWRFAYWIYLYDIVLSVLSPNVIHAELVPSTNSTSNECVDEVYQYWLKVLLNRFIRHADLTAAMPSSRRLFDAFLEHKMSSATFIEYCKEHRYARSYFNRCDNSTYKKMVVSNFGLADYICATRVGDYGHALPCLQGAYIWATIICKPNCSQFENDSKAYLERSNASQSDIMHLMASDCSYLTCMTICRHTFVKEDCGEDAAMLILDALRISFSTSWDLYEPSELRQMIKGGYESAYPDECRRLAAGQIFDGGGVEQSQTDANTAEKGNSRKIRMLLAVSTNVLTNASLMCRFGQRVQQFFASYCPSGHVMDDVDNDFMSLAISVP